MSKRFRIGLSYFFNNQTNSGIVNYIYNIISALKTLDVSERPEIVVFYGNDAPVDYLKSIDYPTISFIKFIDHPENKWHWRLNNLLLKITKKNYFLYNRYFSKIDCLYPYFDNISFGLSGAPNKIRWLVDFNNRAFPDHYQDKGKASNDLQKEMVAMEGAKVILSSRALLDELKTYYPHYKCSIKILRFASTLPDISNINVKQLLERHDVKVPYLMSPNQFWQHKNQGIILDALKIIKETEPELEFKVLLTGSLKVNRGIGLYAEELKNKIEEFGIQKYVSFLGVLERNDQLVLMKTANALLQPSLYEGWSTLVEEAKALNKFIILSDLPVHKEQINKNVDFFDPYNASELALKMVKQIKNPSVIEPLDYQVNIKAYGKDIISAFN